MTYSVDLRSRVVDAYEDGEGTIRELAGRFALNKNTVNDWLQLYQETGEVSPRPHQGGAPLKLTEEVLAAIQTLLEQQNDRTDGELQQLLEKEYGVSISTTSVNRGVHQIRWSRKKKHCMIPKRTKSGSKKNAKNFERA